MHYVIGDVHGCYEEMMALLHKIESQDSMAKYIFVGDFIDRGPQVWKTLTWMMEHIRVGGKYQSVVGNHEFMIEEWYRDEFLPWWQETNGTDIAYFPTTDYDFSRRLRENVRVCPENIEPIVTFFQSMPYTIEIELKRGIRYHIVHGWLPPESLAYGRKREYAVWERRYTGNYESEDVIIHGHTPTFLRDYQMVESHEMQWPGRIGYRKNAINVDCGCCFAKNVEYPCALGAICLETLEEIYSRSVEEVFDQKQKWEDIYSKAEAEKRAQEYEKKYPRVPNRYREEILQRLRNVPT